MRTPTIDQLDLRTLDDELTRLQARCRLASLLLYLPLVGVALLIAANTHPAPLIRDALLAVGWILLTLGLPAAPLGIVLRILFTTRLRLRCRRLDPDRMPDAIPLRTDDRIGAWRITRLTPHRIELACASAPPIIHATLRLAIETCFLTVCALTVANALRYPHPAILLSTAFVILLSSTISARLGAGRLVITDPAQTPSLTYTGSRLWSAIRFGRWAVSFDELEDITLENGALVVRSRSRTHALPAFADTPLARWRARRLIAMILAPEPPSHTDPPPTIHARV